MSTSMISLLEKLLTESLQKKVKIHSDETLSGGCINHATRLATNQGVFFAKWNAHGPEDLFLREAECLEELAKPETSLVIPGVYVKTRKEEQIPAFLVTDFLAQPTGKTAEQDEQLGRGIAELHRYESEQYGFHHDNYCGTTPQNNRWNSDWVSFFGQQRIWPLVELIGQERGMGTEEKKLYEQLLEKLPHLIGHAPAASLNHGDLWSGNFMYSAHGPAVIDPASYYADREFDLAMMAMFGGYSERVWAAYQEMYPLPSDWKERQDLYMLYHYLNHYYLFGGSYGHQALQITRKYLK